ncbi:hypothetical protein E2562_034889 [Oryza meyeriana var. granulata]|uniref:Uncharacterized protein n=1 Tax=Oryza meyeriana var. granulata TaxID=110450 RepID=A0A6G1C2G5_9ORYZ|nr:hypothetical protein E2562_034889 [Oryza meyeriana var. granulata]
MEERPSSRRHSSRRTDKRPSPSSGRHGPPGRVYERRPSSPGRHESGRTAHRHDRPLPPRRRRKKYLYLVMDELGHGYGIYRVVVVGTKMAVVHPPLEVLAGLAT